MERSKSFISWQGSRECAIRAELPRIRRQHVWQHAGRMERWAHRLGPAARHSQFDDAHALLHARGPHGVSRQRRCPAAGLYPVVRGQTRRGGNHPLRPLVGTWPEAYSPACGPRHRVRMGRQADRAAAGGSSALSGTMPRLSVRGRRTMSDCVFCRIVAKQIPATVVQEDADTLAFMDIGQVNPGHVLVALKSHADNLFGLQDAQAAAVFRTVARVARAIRDAFAPQGLSVYQANGKAAGQTVFHFHVHLVPRHENDGMNLTWPVKNPPREKLEEYAAKIRQKLR